VVAARAAKPATIPISTVKTQVNSIIKKHLPAGWCFFVSVLYQRF
jgi:hypothetical protein